MIKINVIFSFIGFNSTYEKISSDNYIKVLGVTVISIG